jgi:hypothetical protein
MDSTARTVHNITAVVTKLKLIGVCEMKLGMRAATLFLVALPLMAGTVFTVDPTLPNGITAGTYNAGQTLIISVTGTVNLNAPNGQIITNPDGSLAPPVADAGCNPCWAPGYQFFLEGSNTYPTIAGGDGINHFPGGGGNYDLFPDIHSAWAPQGVQTTDTTNPGALRFGSLAYTFADNPTATDWKLLGVGQGSGGGAGTGPYGIPNLLVGTGGTLKLVVVDTFYSNNSGGFAVTIDVAPEPSVIWLLGSGLALFGFTHAFRRLRTRRG